MLYVPIQGIRSLVRGSAALATILCVSQQAAAATSEGLFATRGVGAQSCANLAESEADERQILVGSLTSWIAGYISHANRLTDGVFEMSPVVDNAVLAQLVMRLCAQNQDALVETVFSSILQAMEPGSQQDESEIIELSNDQARIVIRSNALVRVQQALVDLELLAPSDVDGVFGPKTGTALSTFQQQNNLSPSGLPDAVTMLTLFQSDRN